MFHRIKVWHLQRTLRKYSYGIISVIDEIQLKDEWPWPRRQPNFGEGRYIFRDGDWVRP